MKAIHSTIIFVTIVSMLVITSCSKSTTNNPTLLSPANASANIPSNQLFTLELVMVGIIFSLIR